MIAHRLPIPRNGTTSAYQTVAIGIPMNSDGALLMSERQPEKPDSGLWEFPGGKVEPRESPTQALARELKEELGIRIDRTRIAPVTFLEVASADSLLLLLVWLCQRWEGTVRPAEGQALRWISLREFHTLATVPHTDQIVLAIRNLI